MSNIVYDKDIDPDKAWQSYFDLVNAQRKSGGMYTDLDKPKVFPPKIHTKNALVHLLTMNKDLMTKEIDDLLRRHRIIRGRGSIRNGLRRLVAFGFATVSSIPGDRYNRKQWRLTKRGADFALNPPSKTARSKGNGGTKKGSKGSPARTANMCIDPNRPTFNKAIEDAVQSLVATKTAFSAYDVTKMVRALVDTGAVTIDDPNQPEISVKGQMVPNILHDDVKGVVHELFNTGKMANYGRTRKGDYWLYTETVPAPDPAPGSSDPSSDPSPTDGSSYDGTPTL